MPELIIPENSKVLLNHLEGPPDEDMLAIVLPSGYLVDLSWYPKTLFAITVVKDNDWHEGKVFEAYHIKTKNEIIELLNTIMERFK